jgi:hypothetical protein
MGQMGRPLWTAPAQIGVWWNDIQTVSRSTVRCHFVTVTERAFVCLGLAVFIGGCAREPASDVLTTDSLPQVRSRLTGLRSGMTIDEVRDVLQLKPMMGNGCLHHWNDHYSFFFRLPRLKVSYRADEAGKMRLTRAILEVEEGHKEEWPE